MNIISCRDFTDSGLEELFKSALDFETLDSKPLRRKPFSTSAIMATLFLEPSTRTRLSFESAMLRLGGKVISAPDATSSSSLTKGETMYDTIMTISQYADIVVVRTPDTINCDFNCGAHIINAGDGSHGHPTQALLDAYTIWKKFGCIEDLKIGIAGDLTYSRTIHSLMEIMDRGNNQFYLLDTLGEKYKGSCIHCTQLDNQEFHDAMSEMNVLYTNRIQLERRISGYSSILFRLTQKDIDRLPSTSIVMNPGPRRQELPPELDSDPKVVFFQQAKNGIFARMALLKWLVEID